jgi:hypothetical protein
MRILMMVLALGWSSVSLAKAPANQGKTCDAKNSCNAGLTCVAHSGGKSTCEIVCAQSTTCPEDQRCVKDGAQNVCRPTTDL